MVSSYLVVFHQKAIFQVKFVVQPCCNKQILKIASVVQPRNTDSSRERTVVATSSVSFFVLPFLIWKSWDGSNCRENAGATC